MIQGRTSALFEDFLKTEYNLHCLANHKDTELDLKGKDI